MNALRSYKLEPSVWPDGIKCCLGLEETVEQYIEHMLFVMSECKRVLKKSGSLWMNIGDSYGGGNGAYGKPENYDDLHQTQDYPKDTAKRQMKNVAKSLLCIPEQLMTKMVYEQGWTLFNKVIWAKQILMPENYTIGSVMPTSVKGRFNQSWEYLLAFAKQTKVNTCWYDTWKGEGITFEKPKDEKEFIGYNKRGNPKYDHRWLGLDWYFNLDAVRIKYSPINRWGGPEMKIPQNTKAEVDTYAVQYRDRNMQPNHPDNNNYQGQFAGLGEEIEKFGSPRARSQRQKQVQKERGTYGTYIEPTGEDHNKLNHPQGKNIPTCWQLNPQPSSLPHFATYPESLCVKPILTSCPEGGIVLDCFAGTSVTGVVALKLNRQFIGLEKNPEYCAISQKRLDEIKKQIPIKIS